VLFTVILLASSLALAHSGHNQAHLISKWIFSQKAESQIEVILDQETRNMGLSTLERKIMDRYGLKTGHTFDSSIGNSTYRFQRTASGLNFAKMLIAENAATHESIPVNKEFQVMPVAFAQKSHTGHDHSQFPYEWVFTPKVQQRIERNILNEKPFGLIGLSSFHLKKMDRYGIKEGMTFMTVVHYSHLMAKRTSSGFHIVDVTVPEKVANLPIENDENKF
jgi:hypothetical protein